MNRLRALFVSLAIVAGPAGGAAPETDSATAIVNTMKESMRSSGFEARMSVSRAGPGDPVPLKLAVVGQFGVDRERLLVRGISPKEIRNRFLAIERSANGQVKAIEFGERVAAGHSEADPFAKLFGSELVLWDLFGAWWDWPKQDLGETEQIGGRDCTLVRSRSGAASAFAPAPIQEVVSCVELGGRLSLRTQLFGPAHKLIRTISVEKTMRKDSGSNAAKRLTIAGEDGTRSEIEVYSGDEHYNVPPETFALLDASAQTGK